MIAKFGGCGYTEDTSLHNISLLRRLGSYIFCYLLFLKKVHVQNAEIYSIRYLETKVRISVSLYMYPL